MIGNCWGTWLIMLGFMDLGWPRVCRRSTSVLLFMLDVPLESVNFAESSRGNYFTGGAHLEWNSLFVTFPICYCGFVHRYRADSRFAPSQWEKVLQSNVVSHWLGLNLEWDVGVLSVDLLCTWFRSGPGKLAVGPISCRTDLVPLLCLCSMALHVWTYLYEIHLCLLPLYCWISWGNIKLKYLHVLPFSTLWWCGEILWHERQLPAYST